MKNQAIHPEVPSSESSSRIIDVRELLGFGRRQSQESALKDIVTETGGAAAIQ